MSLSPTPLEDTWFPSLRLPLWCAEWLPSRVQCLAFRWRWPQRGQIAHSGIHCYLLHTLG